MKFVLKYLSLVSFFLFWGTGIAFSQTQNSYPKRIKIQVYEAETQDPVPFATVHWTGSSMGFQTDFDGKINTIITQCYSDSLRFIFGGLITQTVFIDTALNVIEKTILLKREIIKTQEVTISLGVNPAMKWVNLAIANREKNNPDEMVNYQCEVFAKTILSVNNLSKKIERLKVGRQINALFDTLEYLTGDTEKAVLPVFFSTTLSQYFHQKSSILEREDILATRVRGVGITDGSTASQLTGSSFARYNIYRNRLQLLGKGIVSPIADVGPLFYNYKLIDVDKTHDLRWFVVKISPKNKNDILFNGIIWIEENTGAITRLNLEINEASQINFLDRLRITQEFGNSNMKELPYVLINSRSLVDVSEFSKESMGVLATNVITYRNYASLPEFSKGFFDQAVVVAADALNKSDSFWYESAHIKPNIFEQKVVDKIEAVRDIPTIDRSAKALNFLISGYYSGKNWKVDLGPYYYLALLNPLEGFRTRWGFRTSNNFSKTWQFEAFGAYGFKDERFKYGANITWYKNIKKGEILKISRTEDTELLGFVDNENMTSGDALILALNMFFSNSLAYSKNTYFSYQRDIIRGLDFNVKFSHRIYDLPYDQRFKLGWLETAHADNISTHLNNALISLRLTYEPQVFYVINDNRRSNWASPGPKYTLTYQQAVPNVFGSQHTYSKLSFNFTHTYIWPVGGRTQYKISANKIFGSVPFPLLNIPLGNQSFVYNARAFNQMYLFEFVTDQNIELISEHHFNGFFLNRIPLLNRLGWREVVSAKMIEGYLSNQNQQLIPVEIQKQNNVVPIKSLNFVPYFETGVGIENIFKFIRVDAIWRLSHPSAGHNFGIKVSSYLEF